MSASIYRRERIEGKGWRYVRVNSGRGRRPAEAPPYYVRFTVGGKRSWSEPYKSLKSAIDAAGELPDFKEAVSRGISIPELMEIRNADRLPIRVAVDNYLEQKKSKAPKTFAQYRLALNEFIELISDIRFVDQITPDVLRRYKRLLGEKVSSRTGRKYDGRTIHLRLNVLYFMLKKNGCTVRLDIDEMPTVEEEPAIPYSDSDLDKLFAGMRDDDERLAYKFFLGSACRSKEVKFAAWSDINFDKSTYTIRSKPDVGFTVKNHESRVVRLPSSLIFLLKERRANAPHQRWIFVNNEGNPENHFLRRLKEIALRVGLNCGQCRSFVTKGKYQNKRKVEVTCKTEPVCDHIFLHRLRKTCATRWQGTRHPVPVRTIQAWLGHKNLETTMLYLGVTDSEKLGGQVDEAFGD